MLPLPRMKAELRTEKMVIDNEEQTVHILTHDGHSMKFMMDIKSPDANGYPLYITLHGGGGAGKDDNDQQWNTMFYYYSQSVDHGIYIAVRGITDTWDMHFQRESYPLYDRLIQVMIRLYQADPNRVYLLGFSAGGDGVYQVAPRMADRFAAANMSSGHPNSISLQNLANLPFSIQAGVRDYLSEEALRCVRAAEFEQVLSDYHDLYAYGYAHQVLIRVPSGHNFNDKTSVDTDGNEELSEVLTDPTSYANPTIVRPLLNRFLQIYAQKVQNAAEGNVMALSYHEEEEDDAFSTEIRKTLAEQFLFDTMRVNGNAVDYVNRFTRNPVPLIVWDLETRADSRKMNSFYWLSADTSVNKGTIVAVSPEKNHITLIPKGLNGDFSILVNPMMTDVSRPIQIKTPEGTFLVRVNPSMEMLQKSLRLTGDPCLVWVAEISYRDLIGGKLQPYVEKTPDLPQTGDAWLLAGWMLAAGTAASFMLGLHFLKKLTRPDR